MPNFIKKYWTVSSWRVCDQIETLGTDMLPNVNDHATKLTLFDKDFHVPRLPILTSFQEVLELVEVCNSILALLFKD